MENYCEWKDGCLLVRMPKELDHHQAGLIRAEADLIIDTCRVQTLIFDFKRTEFMDSSGIGVIIGRSRKMGYQGGRVVAQNLNQRMEKIFVVSGLHKMIQKENS